MSESQDPPGKKSTNDSDATGPPKTVLHEYFESAVVTVIMALFGMTFIVQAVKVPTGSMQNTITIGDHLLVNKFIFAPGRSEEHTSELQSQSNLVCRLLLEKKVTYRSSTH